MPVADVFNSEGALPPDWHLVSNGSNRHALSQFLSLQMRPTGAQIGYC